MRKIVSVCIIFILFLVCNVDIFASDSLNCSVVNYSDQEIASAAMVLEAGSIYSQLGLASSSPLKITDAATSQGLDIVLEDIDGTAFLLIFLSLESNQRRELIIEAQAAWPSLENVYTSDWDPATKQGLLSNGAISVKFDSSGLDVFYAGDLGTSYDRSLLNNVYFKGWLDNMDRGAITGDPAALGLAVVDTRNAAIQSGTCSIVDGVPTMNLVRTFSGMGAGVQLLENISLPAGLAAVKYQLLFQNNGTETVYIAWADGEISGSFAHAQKWNRTPYWGDNLFNLQDGLVSHYVKYWYNPPAWTWCSTWPDSGSGIGFTTLELLTGDHYHNKTMWKFSETSFWLAQVETSNGYLPIAIQSSMSAEIGCYLIAAQPETDAFRQTNLFFDALNNNSFPEVENQFAVFIDGQPLQGAKVKSLTEDFSTLSKWQTTEGNLTQDVNGAKLEITDQYAVTQCAIEVDFEKPKVLQLEISGLSTGIDLEVIARPLDPAQEPVILVGPLTAQLPDVNGLLVHYKFDEISGTTALDQTGNYNGFVTNGTWDADGYDGDGCLSFDTTSFVSVLDSGSLFSNISDEITYSVWVNGAAGQPRNNAIIYGNHTVGGSEHDPLIYVPNSSGDVVFESGSPTIDTVKWQNAELQDWKGQWNHYAFTKNISTGLGAIFCNGQKVAENLSAYSPVSGTNYLTIGGIDRGSYQSLLYDGKLDDFRVYNYALSQPEVMYLSGQSRKTIEINSAGTYIIDISDITGWTDIREFALEIRLTGNVGDYITLGSLTLTDTPPVEPELVSPVNDFNMTDIASYFTWKKITDVTEYQIQLSTDSGFFAYQAYNVTRSSEMCYYFPDQVLAAGQWYWRVRGISSDGIEGQWSQIRHIVVNDYHPKEPVGRLVNRQNPLFTLEAYKIEDLNNFADSIPQDIRPHTAIVNGNQYFIYNQTTLEHFAPIANQDNSYLIRTHGPSDMEDWISLADVEWMFANYPNVIGICVGENFWSYWLWDTNGYKPYVTRLIKLCAKYGKLYIWGDGNGTTFKWQQYASDEYWAPFAAEYSDYLVFALKNNVNLTMHTSQGALMGMWLSGMIESLGTWCECWYWNDAGFGELGDYLGPKLGVTELMPRNFYNISFMTGLAQGASLFCVDGQGTTGTSQVAIWDGMGNTTETFDRYIVPFIRGLTSHEVVPSKSDVLDNVKVAIEQPLRFENIAHNGDYGIYEPLYEATYGFRVDGKWYEYIPNTGKYYYIPLLPYGVNSFGDGVHVESLYNLTDTADVESVFDSYYTQTYDSQALVTEVGDSIFIQSTHENMDITEGYNMSFDRCNIKSISGSVGPHKYIMGKFEDIGTTLWLQANTEYPLRETSIILDCIWQPYVEVTPASALVNLNWDAGENKLILVLSHIDGAVEVSVISADMNTDGNIDLNDFSILISNWLENGQDIAGDLNNDSVVDFNDFAIFAYNSFL